MIWLNCFLVPQFSIIGGVMVGTCTACLVTGHWWQALGCLVIGSFLEHMLVVYSEAHHG